MKTNRLGGESHVFIRFIPVHLWIQMETVKVIFQV